MLKQYHDPALAIDGGGSKNHHHAQRTGGTMSTNLGTNASG
jgi:hypothetical protein